MFVYGGGGVWCFVCGSDGGGFVVNEEFFLR